MARACMPAVFARAVSVNGRTGFWLVMHTHTHTHTHMKMW